MDAHQGIHFLHILQEVRSIGKTRNQLYSIRFSADYFRDCHIAPRRQYIFVLSGAMEMGIGDGTTHRFGLGDVVVADELTGQGHTTRSVGVPRVRATVATAACYGII